MNCLFCEIANKEKLSDIIYEDKDFLAFKDINPRAPLHILIIPKKHIESVDHLEDKDKKLMGELFLVVKKIAREKNLKGYKLVFNVGRKAGQLIEHLHLHLLAGTPVELP